MSIRLMSRVWDETRFKGTDLLVLLCLADHANDDGICWPAYDRIAARARCTRRQAIRCVERLIAEGWVTKDGRKPVGKGGYVNIFRVGKRGDILSPTKRGDNSDEGGDILGDNGVTPMSPKPSYESSLKEPVLAQGRASEISFQDLPDIEEVEEVVCSSTGLDFTHAAMCAEKWLKAVQGKKLTDWRAHLAAFADKYECDYRR